ncbi:MAG TPA: mechanosensitive ion channel [Gemmatimonadaceae bacterium]|nr:mechanosensitive ion channel [Gemmatimonadaceae bacterium]
MDLLSRFNDSLRQLKDFIPGLVGAAVLLVFGYLLARVVQRMTARVLRRVNLNRAFRSTNAFPGLDRAATHVNPTRLIATLMFWVVMFSAMLIAAEVLGVDSVAQVFSQMVSYIPSVIAAIVVVIISIVLGDFVGGLIMASAGALHGGTLLARAGKGGVILLGVFMALQELGVGTDIVTTAFAIIFGAVALALALSFGLGNRELAGEITRAWYAQWKAESEAIEREVAAEEKAEGIGSDD